MQNKKSKNFFSKFQKFSNVPKLSTAKVQMLYFFPGPDCENKTGWRKMTTEGTIYIPQCLQPQD